MRRIGIVRHLPAFTYRHLEPHSFYGATIPRIAFAEEGLIAVDNDYLHSGLGKDRDVREAPLERYRVAGNRPGTFRKNEQIAALFDRLGATVEKLIGVEIISEKVRPFDHAAEKDVPRELVFDDALNAWIDRAIQ